MKGRNVAGRVPAKNADDKYVPLAIAKKDWFLTSDHLLAHSHRILKSGGGAIWGVGRVPTYYRVKDLDRVAVLVHGTEGLAKKKEARVVRTQKKQKKQVLVDDNDIEATKPRRQKTATPAVSERQQKEHKKKRILDDGDYQGAALLAEKKKRVKPALFDQEEFNLHAIGKWNVDCEDCVALEIRKAARDHELRGDAVVNNCDVKLHCTDISAKEMQFKAIFKTQKASLVGRMCITVESKDKLSVTYNNGGKGLARAVFDATATRAKK